MSFSTQRQEPGIIQFRLGLLFGIFSGPAQLIIINIGAGHIPRRAGRARQFKSWCSPALSYYTNKTNNPGIVIFRICISQDRRPKRIVPNNFVLFSKCNIHQLFQSLRIALTYTIYLRVAYSPMAIETVQLDHLDAEENKDRISLKKKKNFTIFSSQGEFRRIPTT